jgi:putative phage-type endonuclease
MRLAAHRIGTAATGSPEWHALREGRMSGSRIAAAAGLSPWTSPFSLYYELLGMVPLSEPSEEMRWGTILEEPISREYARQHPNIKLRTRCGVWVNNDRPWQVASPDGFIIDAGTWEYRRKPTGIWEGKTARYDDLWGQPGTDEIPIYYKCQVLHYLDVFGLRYADISCLFTGSQYREYRVEWDQEDAEYLREVGWEMLQRVKNRDRPDIDGSESTYKLIQQFHPEIDGTTVDVPEDIAAELIAARQEFDAAEKELTRTKAVLAEYMGTAKVAQVPIEEADPMKLADRRSKNGGQPYLQMATIKDPHVKLSQLRKVS